MRKGIILVFIIGFLLIITGSAYAVSFSVERSSSGEDGSALSDAPGTGTLPNTVYNSDLSGTNTVGASGVDTGTSGTQGAWGNRPGQDIDAIFFGQGINPDSISRYCFSLDFGAGYSTSPYPVGSGTEAAQGTGTAPINVYSSRANGTNENPYPFTGPDLGILAYSGSNLDAFNLADFNSPGSYPLYFSLDLFNPTDIDFDEDDVVDVTVGGADILVSEGDGLFSPFLSANDLGLDEYDNLDALTRLSDGSWLFSVDYESQGLDGTAVALAGGTGRRPANIYRSFGDGNNYLWLSSEALGLPSGHDAEEYGPNLDALDVSFNTIPEPASLSLLGLGLLGLVGFRKKPRKNLKEGGGETRK